MKTKCWACSFKSEDRGFKREQRRVMTQEVRVEDPRRGPGGVDDPGVADHPGVEHPEAQDQEQKDSHNLM